jgi:hypothetical protein
MPINQPDTSQYDRITQLLREQSGQSFNQVDPAMRRALFATAPSAASFMEGLQQAQGAQVANEQSILDIFNAKRAAGDKQTQALADKIKLFAGDDPQGTAMFLQELHGDPEEIDPSNSYQVMTKLAGIAKRTGYQSPESQLTQAKIATEQARRSNILAPKSAPTKSTATGTSAKISGGTGDERMLNELTMLDEKRRGGGLNPSEQTRYNFLRTEIDPAAREAGKARGKAESKILQDINTNALNSGPALLQLEGVENSIKNLGDIYQGPIAGMLPNVSTEAQMLDAQSTKDALQFVNETKGAVSDREMTMFRQASVGTNKQMRFNENYIKAARATLIRQQQQQQFFNAYNEAYGTLSGAFEAFKKFANDNPIFKWNKTTVDLLKTPEDVANDTSYLNYIASAPAAIESRTQDIFNRQDSGGWSIEEAD